MVTSAEHQDLYYPGDWGDWERREPAEVGMNPDQLQKAVDFSIEIESEEPRDLALGKALAVKEPHDELIGPMQERGDVNGLIVRNGYIVAEWGPTTRVDMTFSVTKSYLSSVAGLAYDRGLIRDLHDRVGDYVTDGGFDSPHNSQITWHQLLNQTSDWHGTLWGKPDWIDRPGGAKLDWPNRELHAPGTRWKYNDVRVNRLALSLLRIWREPLPRVLSKYIMDPISASPTWQWHGYENSWVTVDGLRMQSVGGGGHWGGGLWICARDHARFGYLCLRNGKWKDRQLLSRKWIELASTPTGSQVCEGPPRESQYGIPAECQSWYGYMNWFLNTGHQLLPSAPESSYYHSGAGSNIIWVDPEHDLVVVVRWIKKEHLDQFLKLVLSAVQP